MGLPTQELLNKYMPAAGDFADGALMEMAGNAFNAIAFAAVVIAIIDSVPIDVLRSIRERARAFRERSSDESDDDRS